VTLDSSIKNLFAVANLGNKNVNIDTELFNPTINDIAVIKKLTGRQPIRIERKKIDMHIGSASFLLYLVILKHLFPMSWNIKKPNHFLKY
jgi:phage/plasmid-associated DNA primase